MKIAELLEAAMKWTVMIEGRDELGEVQRARSRIENGFERLKAREIGLSIDDRKRIMTTLQELVARRELAAYARARRVHSLCLEQGVQHLRLALSRREQGGRHRQKGAAVHYARGRLEGKRGRHRPGSRQGL